MPYKRVIRLMGIRSVFFSTIIAVFLIGCSTENTSYISKKYHGTTARYNGLFNANELLNGALRTFKNSRKENFFEILPIEPLPNEEEVKGMLPAIDTAISKCANVIRNHSMPSAANMSRKSKEYNKWIDENWITVGKAMFYKMKYEKSTQNFEFIDKFFKKDPSKYIAELWLAKIQIQQGNFSNAKIILKELIEISESQKKMKFKSFLKKFSKPNKKEDVIPKIQNSLMFGIYSAYADLAIKSKNYTEAKEMLSLAIKKCKNLKEKTRLSYILGQLYQKEGVLDSAAIFYGNSVRSVASFEVAFNGRLNQAICSSGNSMDKKLLRMIKDSKNAPFKDQIYYALAKVSINRKDIPQAKIYLTKSAFYSNGNKRQRAMSYELLGDLSFGERDYIPAQKYYDSCSRYIDDTYPNGKLIKNKADKLSELVKYVERANYEDSVQKIAQMSEKERNDFVKDVLKKIKDDIKRKKEQEALRLLELQAQQNKSLNKNSNKFVFNNPKLRDLGFQEFQKLWGPRENEDDWRRSNKIIFNETSSFDQDSTSNEVDEDVKEEDTLTVERLLSYIPLNDSLFQLSVISKQEALYKSGILYKDILNENELANEQFKKAMNMGLKNSTDLSASFQYYRLNETKPDGKTTRDYIIKTYPDSDVAKYLEDPDFYIKQKANKANDQKNYLALVSEYSNGSYLKVLNTSDSIMKHNSTNALMAEYMMLNALAFGQLNEDKTGLVEKLKAIISQKDGTSQADLAKEMLDIIKNGYSKNEKVEFEKKYIYKYIDGAKEYIIVLLDENAEKKESLGVLLEKVSDFTSKSLKRRDLKVTSKMTMKNTSFVMIQKFDNQKQAQEYINAFKAGYEYLRNYQDNKIYIINQENLKKLIETSKFDEYNSFYIDYY